MPDEKEKLVALVRCSPSREGNASIKLNPPLPQEQALEEAPQHCIVNDGGSCILTGRPCRPSLSIRN